MATTHWTTRNLEPIDITVGPWAWDARLLLHDDSLPIIAKCPSLVCIRQDETDETLARMGKILQGLPKHAVMLGVREPEFTRQLPALVRRRLALLGRPVLDVLMLGVEGEAADLKTGSSLQVLFDLRTQGLVRWLGLAHEDVRALEWMARHTPVRVLQVPHHLQDQSAQYRLLETAQEYGMVCVAQPCPELQVDQHESHFKAWRFSLAMAVKVLPLCCNLALCRLESPLAPMSAEELALAWADYTSAHQAPAPLPRGRPVMD